MKFEIQMGKLYLLSGIPGAGKSTFLKKLNLPTSMVVSTDALREMLLGVREMGEHIHHFQGANAQVFSIAKQIVETRCKEKLTTFVDATLLTDADRAEFAKIGQAYGVGVEVLLFDTELDECIHRNELRRAKVPVKVIERMHGKLQCESRYPLRFVPQNASVELVPNCLASIELDVIGDVHGLYDEFMRLLSKLGYEMVNGVPTHHQGRKLLFLGDVVDRGQQSIEMLQLTRRCVAAGHYMVIGNHERKLVQFWESLQKGTPQARSPSSAETAMQFMRLKKEEQLELIAFIKSLPGYYTLEFRGKRYAFTHACLTHFDPMSTLHSECMYGSEGLRESGEKDPDGIYADNYARGINQHILIRGHIPGTSAQSAVISLEHEQAFEGHLAALRFDEFLKFCAEFQSTIRGAKAATVLEKSDFNFSKHSTKFVLKSSLERLVTEKLAVVQYEEASGLALFKYSKQVFFDALWDKSAFLLKARGIVLDLAGNIVVHPFDKVFNYGENNAGKELADAHPVVAVEKLNGFLGSISKHPYRNDLLLTTSGSFDSPFVQYIRDFITPELKGRLLKFFSRNDKTLMFEVLHPQDPHIIEYSKQEHGLWLIGSRGKHQTSQVDTEEVMDGIAQEIGLRRPQWKVSTFGDVKKEVETLKTEGYMVRDAITHETILKFKTPYYLVTKFLGRLSDKKIKSMYAHPKGFKQTVDEEFYTIVDHLVASVPQESFSAMSDDERVVLVRQTIAELI